ncbi:syntaxin protein [Toxoplasma gondii ME49]|uniref:Syntaxin protein n=4 Tax=Toxoplasma gondii TaxID=5811 RepID=A0A2G8XUI3_TOXGO|nr:syntaxin protein [Toxoplasma gondii ME49]EPT32281.1 syntaxin protein [Toxoplasma gondii ME49]KFG34798.1 syntaxin protein [Toxoplasma gondii GAB2-2007-GAL-DOM2]KYF41223.1 syntaxin protein [Toxoplasma gondii ARI]PIL98683.1 syntaxin protein [Toxoplasma gondii COUG]|eukprot:XP_018638424.1 syntaxin protein [Toxoplasma gondii ME49]
MHVRSSSSFSTNRLSFRCVFPFSWLFFVHTERGFAFKNEHGQERAEAAFVVGKHSHRDWRGFANPHSFLSRFVLLCLRFPSFFPGLPGCLASRLRLSSVSDSFVQFSAFPPVFRHLWLFFAAPSSVRFFLFSVFIISRARCFPSVSRLPNLLFSVHLSLVRFLDAFESFLPACFPPQLSHASLQLLAVCFRPQATDCLFFRASLAFSSLSSALFVSRRKSLLFTSLPFFFSVSLSLALVSVSFSLFLSRVLPRRVFASVLLRSSLLCLARLFRGTPLHCVVHGSSLCRSSGRSPPGSCTPCAKRPSSKKLKMQDLFEDLRELARQLSPQAAPRMHAWKFRDSRSASVGVCVVRSSNARSPEEDEDTESSEQDGEEARETPQFMTEYFEKIHVLKRALQEISKNLEKMKDLKRAAVTASNPDEERDASHLLNKLLDATTGMIRKTKGALQVIKEENLLFTRRFPEKISEGRIRFNMHQIVARHLQQITVECQQAETEYKTVIKKRICRQVKIVYPEASAEEVEQLVESGDLSAAAAVKMRVTGTHQSLRNAVADLQDKYRDILRLEQSVAELHQMFVELAFLVDQQGELLDQIQYNVTNAKDYTAQAEKELLQARKNQQSAKKRMCWLSVCILVLVIIILVPVILNIVK